METLRSKVKANMTSLVRDLDVNKEFITMLAEQGVMDISEGVKFQLINQPADRNRSFLDAVMRGDDDTVYRKLITCLHRSGQMGAASQLMDVREEMLLLSDTQNGLDEQLKDIQDFLKTEERRAGIYLTEPELDDDETGPALTEPELWNKVQSALIKSKQQLSRCQTVIKKLHTDCETVAKQNYEIIEQTRECDAKIKEVLTVGRHSAKQTAVPRKTQDIFANLMDDIEKLVKTRRKVITMETEGRRHSTRIVRQCRDWIESRCLALKKLNSSHVGGLGLDANVDGPMESHREAPPMNDNAIMSILDSLQLMERELQEYVHEELTLSDKYRAELRRKQLQKKVYGFTVNGMADMERILRDMEKHPDTFKDNVMKLQSYVSTINKEYEDCLTYLDKVCPSIEEEECSSQPPTQREMRTTRRNSPTRVGKSVNNGMRQGKATNKFGIPVNENTEHNQMLKRIKVVVSKYDELKAEEQKMGAKYLIEVSKKKRELDLVIQRKEDQIITLQTKLKESEAEKEKFKKLYNDTKIGYQRNENASKQ